MLFREKIFSMLRELGRFDLLLLLHQQNPEPWLKFSGPPPPHRNLLLYASSRLIFSFSSGSPTSLTRSLVNFKFFRLTLLNRQLFRT